METDMLRSIGKQSGESVESVLKKKKQATVEGFSEKNGMYRLYVAILTMTIGQSNLTKIHIAAAPTFAYTEIYIRRQKRIDAALSYTSGT